MTECDQYVAVAVVSLLGALMITVVLAVKMALDWVDGK